MNKIIVGQKLYRYLHQKMTQNHHQNMRKTVSRKKTKLFCFLFISACKLLGLKACSAAQ
jgi:cell division protein FtsB